MEIDYRDLAADGSENSIEMRLRFEWQGLKSADLKMLDNDVVGVDFRYENEVLVTEFEMAFGLYGSIVASDLEVELVRVASDPAGENQDEDEELRLLIDVSDDPKDY
jgi:hypothetical protein